MFKQTIVILISVIFVGCTSTPPSHSVLDVAVKNNGEAAASLVELQDLARHAHDATLIKLAERKFPKDEEIKLTDVVHARYRRLFVLFQRLDEMQKKLGNLFSEYRRTNPDDSSITISLISAYADLQLLYNEISIELSRAR